MKLTTRNTLIMSGRIDTIIPIIANILLLLSFLQRHIIPVINAAKLLTNGIPNFAGCPHEMQINITASEANIADNTP